MKKIKAYNAKSQCLFSAENQYDIEFHGSFTPLDIKSKFGVDCEPEVSYSWDDKDLVKVPSPTAEWLGNLFLSNTHAKLISLLHFASDKSLKYSIVENARNFNKTILYPAEYKSSTVKKTEFICLSGFALGSPESLSDIGREFQYNRFFIPEIKSAVGAIGAMVNHLAKYAEIKPYRATFFKENTEDLNFESQENNWRLAKHDAAGKMAFLVHSKGLAFNDIMQTPHSSFFGKYLAPARAKNSNPIFFTHEKNASELFEEPSSVFYISQYLPVKMKVKSKFKEEVGFTEDEAVVRLININDNEQLLAYDNFYCKLAQERVFQVLQPKEISIGKVPLFRYNKSYIVSSEFVKESYRSIA